VPPLAETADDVIESGKEKQPVSYVLFGLVSFGIRLCGALPFIFGGAA
jgi:hypothetical protein